MWHLGIYYVYVRRHQSQAGLRKLRVPFILRARSPQLLSQASMITTVDESFNSPLALLIFVINAIRSQYE